MDIDLLHLWIVDTEDVVGSGGFGTVYGATNARGFEAVAKFVQKQPGANRELLATELPDSKHLVPIIDSGDSDDSWVLIMPRADFSLRDRLDQGVMELSEALSVLSQIAQGLADIGGSVVHRDLKPENVLFLDANWALTDFGIARYVEATTAPDTHKFSLSAAYAAPEQWKFERATPATDVYALGVIAFEVLSGERPFPGPDLASFREQHLHTSQPALNVSARLSGLVGECLFKPAGARPNAENILARLSRVQSDSKTQGAGMLADAQRAATARLAEQARRLSIAQTETERRASLFATARVLFEAIVGELREAVVDEAPAASGANESGSLPLRLSSGSLHVSTVRSVTSNPWALSTVEKLDVVAFAEIGVRQTGNDRGYEGRSHSLSIFATLEIQASTAGLSLHTWHPGVVSIVPFCLSL